MTTLTKGMPLLPGVRAWADIDGEYRYRLIREWSAGPVGTQRDEMVFVMLNPSVADGSLDDRTLRRCQEFARREGMRCVTVVNLYALRATKPADVWAHPDPVGPRNDIEILRAVKSLNVAHVVAAWGAHGKRNGRGAQVAQMLTSEGVTLECLRITKDGYPEHPLYIPGDKPLEVYRRP